MNSQTAALLLSNGVLLVALGLTSHYLSAEPGRVTFLAGAIGGALSLLWGILALLKFHRRGWVIFTLAIVAFVLLSQSVQLWMDGHAPATVATLATVMCLACITVLTRIAHAGDAKS